MMDLPLTLLISTLVAMIMAVSLTGFVRKWLVDKAILDQPNERSSHSVPTPRGGGLAVVPSIALPILIMPIIWPDADISRTVILPVVVSGLGMAALSWIDDRRGLSARIRLLGQAICVIIAMTALPGKGLVFLGYLPPILDHLVTFFAWIWFINLYNFMDGIDGITGMESLSIGGAVAIFAAMGFISIEIGLVGGLIAGAAIGFLFWNWAPAKIFMGDIGSTALGLWLGWVLMALASQGQFAAAALLPLYYAFDATWRLLRRALKREKVWQAHRSHFYQQSSRALKSHAKTVLLIAGLNGLLVLLAFCAITNALPGELALACGFVLTGGLCNIFHRQALFAGEKGNGKQAS